MLDPVAQVLKTTDPLGDTSKEVYDLAGEIKASQDALGFWTTDTYNLRGWQTQTKDARGNTWTTGYDGEGNVRGVRVAEVDVQRVGGRRVVTVIPGTEQVLPADIVLLAIGFDGTEEGPLLDQLGLTRQRGAIQCGADWQTDVPGVFVAGDMHRGASLIAWSAVRFSGTVWPRRHASSCVIKTSQPMSFIRSESDSAEKPPNTTMWGAPRRVQASMAIGSSGTIPM